MSEREYDYFATGPRMAMLPARALENGGMLGQVHIDAVFGRGSWARKFLASRPRASQRAIEWLPHSRIMNYPILFLLARLRRYALERGSNTEFIERLLIKEFERIARRCDSALVFGMQNSSLEIFAGRDVKIMEQFSHPHDDEATLLATEDSRFPGWLVEGAKLGSEKWLSRAAPEWEIATRIWAPSEAVVDACVASGGQREKFCVIPYPVPDRARHEGWTPDRRPGARPRVLFAGTVGLLKGVQYIYLAFMRSGLAASVDLHFVGPSHLGKEAIEKLASVGTVHGPIPRAELLEMMQRADALLLPSLAEGTALVTLEATSLGVPVIATRESGAPESAHFIEARSADAIAAAVTELLEDRGFVSRLAEASAHVAANRTATRFSDQILDLARQHAH